MQTITDYIFTASEHDGTDIHLVAGVPPIYRDHDGHFAHLRETPLDADETNALVRELFQTRKSANYWKTLDTAGDVDLSYTAEREGFLPVRCRVNVFREDHGLAIAIRILKLRIPTRQELRLPTVLERLIRQKHGLILFTAPTGNGKTTSIASLLNEMNATMEKRIITIEDPVEYRFEQRRSIFSQREVGIDCPSFAHGLKSALREDPDVILVGEMRDRETIRTALSAAETGHLVFSTLHAPNVVEAIDRLTQYFDAEEQNTIRLQIANAMLAIIAQQLLPKRGGGKIAAFEILCNTPAISSVIRQGKTYAIPSYMEKAKGMQHMDESIQELEFQNLLEREGLGRAE